MKSVRMQVGGELRVEHQHLPVNKVRAVREYVSNQGAASGAHAPALRARSSRAQSAWPAEIFEFQRGEYGTT